MDNDELLRNDGPPLEFRLGSRLVVAEKAELLDPTRTIYRLDLKRPPLLVALIQAVVSLCPWMNVPWPWFLPPTVILKKRKDGWEEEFEKEKQAYDVLKPIQGTIVPQFYGEAVYDGSPTLVLSFIDGKTLFDLWRDRVQRYTAVQEAFLDEVTTSPAPEDCLRELLEEALRPLTSYGVHYTDTKLDNFLIKDDGRVMVVDLEQVELDTTPIWEESVNSANVDSLIETLRMMRQYSSRTAARVRQSQQNVHSASPVGS
ncbi:hypothetical protein N658DRAFT_481541 [Parathielavia hyrcaniae]|uniref:Protein kinase domain-containing protein n=1 Tax=Parathielavia hyrcaniae TaxID=113614 RepID=A0AAN6PQ37_9PEZI|nr:hypothetical protein N658DRAFT_481541 [Parathielavia hyrcaniae]